MKALVKYALAALSILLTSCVLGEGGEKNKKSNYFYVGSNGYALDRGMVMQNEAGQSIVVIYGEDLDYDSQTGIFNGDGLYLYFLLNTTSGSRVDNGVYSYYYPEDPQTKSDPPVYTFSDESSYFILNGDDFIRDHFMEGSRMTVSHTGGNYSINIVGATYSAGSVSGTFNGSLIEY